MWSRIFVIGLFCTAPLLSCGSSDSSSSGQGGSGGSATSSDGGGFVAAGGNSSSDGAGGTMVSTGGSAGSNGLGGMPLTHADCVKDRPFQNNAELSPDVRKTITGSNGTFTDECDSAANLIEYICEGTQICANFPNPSCQPGPETG